MMSCDRKNVDYTYKFTNMNDHQHKWCRYFWASDEWGHIRYHRE